MCGFAGILSLTEVNESILRSMITTLRHRGPDNEGIWCDQNAGIGLGHTRLSILDLSPAGHQPMFSGSGRYVITFNGEIYNHLNLRIDLQRREDSTVLSSREGSAILTQKPCLLVLTHGGLRLQSKDPLVCLHLLCGTGMRVN